MDRKIVLPMLIALALALPLLSACAQPTPAAAPAVALDSTATAIPPTDTPTPLPPTNTPVPPTDTPVPTDTATPTSTSTPTSTPTDTPQPPTNTPVPPTATRVPPTPTRTRVPPSRTPQVLTLPLALKRTFDTKTYRFEMHMFYSDPYSETEMMNATGERSGSIVHIMMGSMYGKLLTGDPNGRAELMYVGTKTYIRGPVPLYKANEARWYIMPSCKEGSQLHQAGGRADA